MVVMSISQRMKADLYVLHSSPIGDTQPNEQDSRYWGKCVHQYGPMSQSNFDVVVSFSFTSWKLFHCQLFPLAKLKKKKRIRTIGHIGKVSI